MEKIKSKTLLLVILMAMIIASVLDSGFFTNFWTKVFLFFLLMLWGWATVTIGNKEL